MWKYLFLELFDGLVKDKIYEQIEGRRDLSVRERRKLRILKNQIGKDGNSNMECFFKKKQQWRL